MKLEKSVESRLNTVNDQTIIKKNSLLHIAVENKQLHIIRFLVKSGADVNKKNFLNKTPMNIAEDMMDLNYQNSVARLLKGDPNLVETEFSRRKLENLYSKLMKKNLRSLSVNKLKPIKKQIFIEDYKEEAEVHWDQIRKTLIEKKISMADMYEMLDKNDDGGLKFSEFQSMIV